MLLVIQGNETLGVPAELGKDKGYPGFSLLLPFFTIWTQQYFCGGEFVIELFVEVGTFQAAVGSGS